jgi:hypothetical protein
VGRINGDHDVGIGFFGTCDEGGLLVNRAAGCATCRAPGNDRRARTDKWSRISTLALKGRCETRHVMSGRARLDADFAPTLAFGSAARRRNVVPDPGDLGELAAGKRGQETYVDLARSFIGIAVRQAHPDIAGAPRCIAALATASVGLLRIGASAFCS